MFSFLFPKKQTEADKLAQQRQDASIKALEAGDIPLVARERLVHQSKHGKDFFSSDLTTREYLFAREAGYQPIGQVMGCAFMNISLWGGRQIRQQTEEVYDVSKALSDARQLAVNRLLKEAELLNATGVIGIRLTTQKHGWDERMMEFTAIGTAIRVPGHEQKSTFTSLLTGQEFWQLHQGGYWPVGVCMGTCSYYVRTDMATRKILYSWWGGNNQNNNEIRAYTQGFYEARERALSRISLDIEALKADGCVGMRVDQDVKDIEYEVNDRTYHDFLCNFSMMGTAIIKEKEAPAKPHSTLVIYDLAQKKNRNVDIDFNFDDGTEFETDNDSVEIE